MASLHALLVLAGLACLAVGTWRAFPTSRAVAPDLPGLRAILFDVSAGTTRRRPTYGLWARRVLRDEALAALERGEDLAVAIYGADARSLGVDSAQHWLERLEGRGGEALHLGLSGSAEMGSEVDAGLAALESEVLRADRAYVDFIHFGDLRYSGSDPRPRLSRWNTAGVGIVWQAIPPATLPDLALVGIQLPEEPEVGAPLVARLDFAFAPAANSQPANSNASGGATSEAALSFRIERAGVLTREGRALHIPAEPVGEDGYLRWSETIDLGPTQEGITRVQARARLHPGAADGTGEALPENDLLSASCRAGATRVLALVSGAQHHAELRAWIEPAAAWPGLEWILCTPQQLPALLSDLDLVVTVDLAPRDLPQSVLAEYVRAGGAWFFCAGWHALPGWQEAPGRLPDAAVGGDDELAQLLPLVPAPQSQDPRDIVFLVDGSGSMEGAAFRAVQSALAQLVLTVPRSDSLRLQFFTGTLASSVDLRVGAGGASATLRRLFDARVPGGPTAILYSLEQHLARVNERELPTLTFLLTDGKDEVSHDAASRGAAIAAGLSNGDSRLVVISAGDEPDETFLSTLLSPGQTLRNAGRLEGLDEIFQTEVFQDRVREGAWRVRTASTAALAESRELLGVWREVNADWPPHQRYFRCDVRPEADVLLVADEHGEALLAMQRVGLGRVAAWASCTLAGWAPALRSAPDFFGPLLRSLARPRRASSALHLEQRGTDLELSGVPGDWPAVVRAQFVVLNWGEPVNPSVEEVALGEVQLEPDAPFPGADPRSFRRGAIPSALLHAAAGRVLWVRLLGSAGELGAADPLLGQLDLEPQTPAEFLPGGQPRLREAGLPSSERGSRTAADPSGQPHPHAWVWILAGLVGLFGAAVAGAFGGQ